MAAERIEEIADLKARWRRLRELEDRCRGTSRLKIEIGQGLQAYQCFDGPLVPYPGDLILAVIFGIDLQCLAIETKLIALGADLDDLLAEHDGKRDGAALAIEGAS